MNAGMSVKSRKNIRYAKKMIFGILLHVLIKMVDIQGALLKIE